MPYKIWKSNLVNCTLMLANHYPYKYHTEESSCTIYNLFIDQEHTKKLGIYQRTMANLSFTHFLILFLILSAASMVPEANAQKRCQEELYKTGCTLEDCKKKCYDRHHDLGGTCIQNAAMTAYACYCFWNSALTVPEANAQKRCQEELYKTGCTLKIAKRSAMTDTMILEEHAFRMPP
ncbi:uncharacterized protein LOC125371387 [Ricinus communis]|uniref:uncharacterized protein LOC125371387 n=1 Tax=Ricinus communis TaxID=3988 RepID=UPI00201AE095|nr:uncharacterized protein LOC125371387 [Ricinus communis]